ncbi:hypothetical protein [Vibrio maritimus]|uniref:hypothetical protein n=1 Tax=Vibrio maritimus TaxID=990268 RepID=UPI0037367032
MTDIKTLIEIEDVLSQIYEIITIRSTEGRFKKPIIVKDRYGNTLIEMQFRNDTAMLIRKIESIREAFIQRAAELGIHYDSSANRINKLDLKRKPKINSQFLPLYYKQHLGKHLFVQIEAVHVAKHLQRKGLLTSIIGYFLSIDNVSHVVISNIVNESWYKSMSDKQKCGNIHGYRYAVFDQSYCDVFSKVTSNPSYRVLL